MSGHDFIPRPDGDFDSWQQSFMNYAAKNAPALGLSGDDLDKLHDLQKTWDTDFDAVATTRAAFHSATAAKDDSRRQFVAALRRTAAQLRGLPSLTDAQRAALGLTIPDTIPTPVGPPATAPVVDIDTSQRLQHTLHFADAETPTRRAKPRGIFGAEVWVALRSPDDAPPVDLDNYQFRGIFTRTSALIRFDGSAGGATPGAAAPADGAVDVRVAANGARACATTQAGGLTAHYQLRWLNTRGEAGPLSTIRSATVGA